MPASTVSLGSLSSPSPSPPPPPDDHQRSASNSAGAGLDIDSGSELSELTEEEQENDGRDPHASDSDNNEDDGVERLVPRGRKKKGSGVWGWGSKGNKKGEREWRSHPVVEEEEEEEPAGPVKAMEEEEDDDQEPRSRGRERDDEGPAADRAPPPLRERRSPDADGDSDGDSGDEEGDDEDEGEPEVDQDIEPDAGGDLTDGEGVEDEDEDPRDKSPHVAEEHGSEADDPEPEDVDMQDETQPAIAAVVSADTAPMDAQPIPPPGASMPKAQSSIMAGSAVIEVPLSDESASPSPSSSRSASPEHDAEKEDQEQGHRDTLQERKPVTRASRSKKSKARSRAKKSRIEADYPEVDADGDPGNPTPDVDDADVEGDGADIDDAELDAELESDLQPAHRAEALDVLAVIELKFALLRERLYVEKMDNLAWEENLVAEGTHPEMLHLHTELLKRRDKRLELATRRRDYEIANVTKRRKLDEDAVWSWWQCARDDLQTEMISETNRKRRRLERERRALERPRPERYIPPPPLDAVTAPTLREIVKGYPYGLSDNSHSGRAKTRSSVPLQHPELSVLNTQEVVHDLEWLFNHRRQAVMPPLPPLLPQGVPNTAFIDHRATVPSLGPGIHQARAGYNKSTSEDYHRTMAILDDMAARTEFAPSGLPYPHQMLAQQMQGPGAPPVFSASAHGGRQPHPSFHPSQVLDQDVPTLHRPASASVHIGSHHQHPSAGPSHGPGLMRRSISPVPVHPMQNGQNHGAMGGLPMHSLQGQANGWDLSAPAPAHISGHEPRRANGELHTRDRDKEREREHRHEAQKRERAEQRELERAHERDMERLHHVQMQQLPRPHSHLSHQHIHAPPGQTPHHLLGPHHHHHHHHHVVHHHHGQPGNSSGGGQAPMAALPPPPSAGPSQGRREFETRRAASGAPEVVEVSTAKSAASPHWKSPEEPQPDMPRERGRPAGPPAVGPHERIMTPFVMTPSQGIQQGFPNSPRNGPDTGPPTAPPSVGPSRRGSWSAGAPDDGSVPRPSSSASLGRVAQIHPREPSMPSAPSRRESFSRPQPSSGQASFPSSPRHSGRQLPSTPILPLSASGFTGQLRSPGHPPALPPPPQVPIMSMPPAQSPVRPPSPRAGSPRLYRPSPDSPIPQKPRPDADLVRSSPPALSNVITVKASDSLPLFPPPQNVPHPPRLANGPISGDQPSSSHIPNGPVAPPKPVPVDGP